MLLYIFSLLL